MGEKFESILFVSIPFQFDTFMSIKIDKRENSRDFQDELPLKK